MSYCYEDDQQAQAEYELHQEELRHNERLAESSQEPNVVPCFKCNVAMYQFAPQPEDNLCDTCKPTPVSLP